MFIRKITLPLAMVIALLYLNILQANNITSSLPSDSLVSALNRARALNIDHRYEDVVSYLEVHLDQVGDQDSLEMEIHYRLMIANGHLENHDQQFYHTLKGLELAQKFDEHFMLLSFYRDLGSFHDYPLNDPQTGLIYMKKAIPYIDAVKTNSKCGLMMDIGLTSVNAGQLDSAQYYYDQAFEYLKDYEGMTNDVYSFYTPFLLESNRLEEARFYAEFTFNAWQNIGFRQGYASSAIELAEINFKESKFEEAVKYAKIGLDVGKELKIINIEAESLEWLAKSQEALGRTEEGLISYKSLNIVRDSMEIIEQEQQLYQKRLEFLTTEYKDELAAISEDHSKLSTSMSLSKKALYGTSGALLLFGILYYQRMKSKKKEISDLTEVLSLSSEELSKLKEEYQRTINELDKNKRELTSSALFIEKKDEALKSVRKILSKIDVEQNHEVSASITSARKLADSSINIDSNWESFRYFFEQIYPSFYTTIKNDYNFLNKNDLRYLSYIKIGLTDKEAARLLGINTASFQKSKYRLKKKLELPKEVSIGGMLEEY